MPSIEWKTEDNLITPIMKTYNATSEELLSIVDFNNLIQLNSIKNFYGTTLDLIFTNFAHDDIELQLSKLPIVSEDLYHPSLSLEIKTTYAIQTDNTNNRLNFYKANYTIHIHMFDAQLS